MTPLHIPRPVRWSSDGSCVVILDQRVLPTEIVERELRTAADVREAIRTLAVRGAPAIGIAGAMGLVASLEAHVGLPADRFQEALNASAQLIRDARPTAVNLAWAIDRMLRVNTGRFSDNSARLDALRSEASAILDEDIAMCERIGRHGLEFVRDGAQVLTHCNAGALATGGMGTALAPIYRAAAEGRRVQVFSDETRPLLQGARLTAWELAQSGIPVTVLADSMAASLMRERRIDCCIVGADRIAANGDVANKIGTYALAIAARHHGIPFYVAAPTSTVDPTTARGEDIHIEQRDGAELTTMAGVRVAPEGVDTYNPAFDVTPAELVTAIITDRGVFRPPYHFE